MRKLRNDFVKRKNPSQNNSWYDIYDDWDLIEASIAKQYGIRIREESDMPWDEFVTLVSAIMPDTPLGQIVSIRSETDKKVISRFTKEQRKVYNDWRLKVANNQLVDEQKLNADMNTLERFFAKAFTKKEVK